MCKSNPIIGIVIELHAYKGTTGVDFIRRKAMKFYTPGRRSCDRLDKALWWSDQNMMFDETGFKIENVFTYPDGVSIKYQRPDPLK